MGVNVAYVGRSDVRVIRTSDFVSRGVEDQETVEWAFGEDHEISDLAADWLMTTYPGEFIPAEKAVDVRPVVVPEWLPPSSEAPGAGELAQPASDHESDPDEDDEA